ncbi:L,D-transpeptidase family protein [Halorhodospira abdelmalekii]|uniref:L,D-transpeptidase family protein n=1 Tax=Halorhodospira abdelmalekii TaxID=421629 RepID=UPI001F5B61E6|nr:L,D-transpeptidase family protein [Halorhodospira abdelmalekii]
MSLLVSTATAVLLLQSGVAGAAERAPGVGEVRAGETADSPRAGEEAETDTFVPPQEPLETEAIDEAEAGPTASELNPEEWPRQRHRFALESGIDVVGEEQTTTAQEEDTLLDIAMRYAVGYEEIRRANPEVDTWMPGDGTEVRIPSRYILPDAPREGIVVNLAEMRLYYFPAGEAVVETFPVSIGRLDWSTPLGETRVTEMLEDPAWYPPRSIREQAAERGEEMPVKIPPGPDNPLGRHAILLDIRGYLLHGTNRPWGIGMRATHGCIRLHPRDIEYLFGEITRGMPVKIVNQPVKAGWSAEGFLYVQAFPLFEEEEKSERDVLSMAVNRIAQVLGGYSHRVDGRELRTAVERRDGEVVRISRADAEARERR